MAIKRGRFASKRFFAKSPRRACLLSRRTEAVSPAQKNVLRENEKLRNRHAGQRCFVIGNGPSLATQDLRPLAGEITFVMNAFWKHPILDEWQPTYFCFADPVWHDGSEAVTEFFDSVRERTPAAEYIFPLDGKPIVEKQSLLPLESTYFFAYQEQPIGLSVADTFDLTGPVPYPFSASQLAIMAAMFMGCTPDLPDGTGSRLAGASRSGYTFLFGSKH